MLFQFTGRFDVGGVVRTLERFGFIDVVLPFILVFTVSFAALSKIGIFKGEKKYSMVVAFVIATLFVVPHITGRYRAYGIVDPVDAINTVIPQVGILAVAVVLLLLMLGMFGYPEAGGGFQAVGTLAAISIILIIFGQTLGFFQSPWLYFLSDPDLQTLVIIILVFGLIIKFVTSDPKTSPGEGFMKGLQKFFK